MTCYIMNSIAKRNGSMGRKTKWTYEKLVKVAKSYDNYTRFTKEQPTAYGAARRSGVLSEITGHMVKKKNTPKWNPETIAAEAKKYKTRKDFTKNASSASARAYSLGIMDEVCAHMLPLHSMRRKWTNEALHDEAAKFETLKDFRRDSHSAFVTAHRVGILKEITSHMKSFRQPRLPKDEVIKRAKKFQHRVDFREGDPHAYNSAQSHNIMAEACAHMTRKNIGPLIWTTDKVKVEAKKYDSRSAFQRGCVSAYSAAYRQGILDEVCSHMKNLRALPRKWSQEAIQEVANKYATRGEFAKGCSSAYFAAIRLGILNNVCSHMPKKAKRKRKWTVERLADETMKYGNRDEFAHNAPEAYEVARRTGVIDKICSHMEENTTEMAD